MDDVGWEQVNCVNLLKAMELDGEEEEQSDKDSVLYEEEESMQLPNKWVDIIASQRKNQWSLEIQEEGVLADSVHEEKGQMGDSENLCSQPTTEQLEKATMLEVAVRAKSVKNQWGPILVQKKSKRVP
jgi:hypothetical protein